MECWSGREGADYDHDHDYEGNGPSPRFPLELELDSLELVLIIEAPSPFSAWACAKLNTCHSKGPCCQRPVAAKRPAAYTWRHSRSRGRRA
jgi:hypothetical protein